MAMEEKQAHFPGIFLNIGKELPMQSDDQTFLEDIY